LTRELVVSLFLKASWQGASESTTGVDTIRMIEKKSFS